MIGKNGHNFLGAPPTVPPRVSPGIVSSTFEIVVRLDVLLCSDNRGSIIRAVMYQINMLFRKLPLHGNTSNNNDPSMCN